MTEKNAVAASGAAAVAENADVKAAAPAAVSISCEVPAAPCTEAELHAFLAGIAGADRAAGEGARRRWNSLAKPLGSLGLLEDMAVRIAAVTGKVDFPFDRRLMYVICADNGVIAQGISQSDASVTLAVARALAEGTSTVSYMAAAARCAVQPVDVGMVSDVSNVPEPPENFSEATDVAAHTGEPSVAAESCSAAAAEPKSISIDASDKSNTINLKPAPGSDAGFRPMPGLLRRRVRCGTDDMSAGAAMSRDDCVRAICTGIELAGRAAAQGTSLLLLGEMGIGNTTTSAAVACALLGEAPERMAGRGAGLSTEGLTRKVQVIGRSLDVNRPDRSDPIDVMSKVGGLDIACLCGLCLGGAAYRIPVLLDGVITAVAALCAVRLSPAAGDALLASHESTEPAARLILAELGLQAPVHAGLHLGEGSGAAAALALLDTALAVYFSAHTFDRLGIEAYTEQS